MSGLGDVGSLLALVSDEKTTFEASIQRFQVIFDKGGFSQATLTLKTLLQDGMLYSTTHQLQAVSLLYFADPEGAVSPLTSLAADPVVKSLVKVLLREEGSSFNTTKNLTPTEFIIQYEQESGIAPRPQAAATEPETAAGSTLESLGIQEFIEVAATICSAAKGPLLPKDVRAAISALQNQQVQIDQVEKFPSSATPTEIVLAAKNCPDLAAEVIATAIGTHAITTAVSSWAGACLWALAGVETSINVIACWALLLDKIDDLEPSVLAAFISHSIQDIISREDKITAARSARMLAHLLHRVVDKNNPAILILAAEVETFCMQFISHEVFSTLYAKLSAQRMYNN